MSAVITPVENSPLDVAVVVEGKVISSNLPQFRAAMNTFVAGINRDLKTDNDFAQAKEDAKKLRDLEAAVKAAKIKALEQAQELHKFFTDLDEIGEIPREAALALEKLIATKTESVKSDMVRDALNRLDCAAHLRLKNFGALVQGAIKGKRTLESMEKSLNQIVGSLNEQIAATKAVIAEWEASEGHAPPDADMLAVQNAAEVRLQLQARTQARIAGEEKKRLADEAEKERQARIKAEADAAAAQQVAAPAAPAPERSQARSMRPVSTAPPAPPATTPPPAASAPDEETEAEELARICALVRAQLVSLKPIMDGAKHANNILRIRAFRAAVNPAFAEMQKGGEG